MKKHILKHYFHFISLMFMLASIFLMMMPGGVSMLFASSPGEYFPRTYSFFSEMPLGYGNWFPMITAVLAIGALITLLLQYKFKMYAKYTLLLLVICIGAMILSWLMFGAFTVLGLCICLLHVFALALQLFNHNMHLEKLK